MAIQKAKTLPSGVVADYWKITSISIDKVTLKAIFIVGLYLNAANKNTQTLGPLKTYKFDITREELVGDLTALGYTKIKAKAETMVAPLFGQPGDPLVLFDADLANGEDV